MSIAREFSRGKITDDKHCFRMLLFLRLSMPALYIKNQNCISLKKLLKTNLLWKN